MTEKSAYGVGGGGLFSLVLAGERGYPADEGWRHVDSIAIASGDEKANDEGEDDEVFIRMTCIPVCIHSFLCSV